MILDMIRGWFGGGDDDGPEGSGDPSPGPACPDPEMLSCHEALEWLYEFMDGELPEADAEKVDLHFKLCQACYPHLKLEESFRSRLQSAVGDGAVPDEVRARVLNVLAEEEAGS